MVWAKQKMKLNKDQNYENERVFIFLIDGDVALENICPAAGTFY